MNTRFVDFSNRVYYNSAIPERAEIMHFPRLTELTGKLTLPEHDIRSTARGNRVGESAEPINGSGIRDVCVSGFA